MSTRRANPAPSSRASATPAPRAPNRRSASPRLMPRSGTSQAGAVTRGDLLQERRGGPGDRTRSVGVIRSPPDALPDRANPCLRHGYGTNSRSTRRSRTARWSPAELSSRAPAGSPHRRDRCDPRAAARARPRRPEPVVTPHVDALETPAPVDRLSYFFPAHNEAANLGPLVDEALEVLPTLARTFEIVIVDDGSRDETPEMADRLAAAHPDVVRAVHHPTNLGYGAALRSGLGAARYELVCFTDGDRQFRVVDLGRLLATLRPDTDVVVGYRIQRADPPIRTIYARLYRLANRIFFGLRVRDVDCACKLFRREALTGLRVESGGAFFSAELLIRVGTLGRSIVEVGVPHYARTAGSPTGANPSVIWRAVKDFWALRLRLWANRDRALRRGRPILGTGPASAADAA